MTNAPRPEAPDQLAASKPEAPTPPLPAWRLRPDVAVATTRAQATRAAILEAAVALAAVHGLDGLTYKALGQRLRYSKSRILGWFPQKEDLTAAVMGAVAEDFRAQVTSEVSVMTGETLVRAVTLRYLDWIDRRAAGFSQVAGRARHELAGRTGRANDQLRAMQDAWTHVLQVGLRQAVEAGVFTAAGSRSLIFRLSAVVAGYEVAHLGGPGVDRAAALALLEDILATARP
jgi:AcrR family transcriptional regulator